MDLKALKPAAGKSSPQNPGEQVTQAVAVPDKPAKAPARVAASHSEAVQRTAEQMRQQMAAVAQKLREIAQSNSRDLEFTVDEETDRTVITVRNAATGEVVRQIPGEELLDLQRRLNVGYGTLVDWVV